MSFQSITGYSRVVPNPAGIGIPYEPTVETQNIPITESPTYSEPFGPSTHFVRLCAEAPCRIRFLPPGLNEDATVEDGRLPADWIDLRYVQPGMKLSVILSSGKKW